MKLKIVSDGTVMRTKIYDADTGEQLSRIQTLNINFDIKNKFAECTIKFFKVPVEFEGEINIKEEE